MRLFLPRWWLGTLLLSPLLTGGCQHNKPRCANCTAPSAAGVAVAVRPNASATVAHETAATASNDASATVAHETAATADKDAAIAATSDKPSSSSAAEFPALSTPSPPSSQNLPQGPQEMPTVAASPRFAHDPKYRWLVGTLDYSRIQRSWLLRYTPIEEDDRYGGSVTLVAPDLALNFKDGQTVRVEGALTDPESQQLRPAFRVQNVRVVEP
jgi:hypothetical protein